MTERILVVDDERNLLIVVRKALKSLDCEVDTATSAEIAFDFVQKNKYDLIITDIKLPGKSGIEFIKECRAFGVDSDFIVITAFAATDSAIEALKNGACDYLIKPFNIEELRIVVERVLKFRRIQKENLILKRRILGDAGDTGIIGESDAIKKVKNLIQKVALTDSTVLITGESGVGKELVAKAVHFGSKRREKRFLSINCAALPENLLESELFGYEKGAFTGAESSKPGLFELADGGTLFLDEIGEMPMQMQAKLLRVLQDFTIRRLGGREDKKINVRLICATNRDIEQEIKKGKFREDLFYRINVFNIHVPPLRERKEDIPVLVNYLLNKLSIKFGKNKPSISPDSMKILENYHYPGNVRELENIIERALAIMDGDVILPEHLPELISDIPQDAVVDDFPEQGVDLEQVLDKVRLLYMEKAMRKANGKMMDAAKLLNMSFRSFRYYYHKLKNQ